MTEIFVRSSLSSFVGQLEADQEVEEAFLRVAWIHCERNLRGVEMAFLRGVVQLALYQEVEGAVVV